MNDEMEKKIEKILGNLVVISSDGTESGYIHHTSMEEAERNLAILYTEMVEEELKSFVENRITFLKKRYDRVKSYERKRTYGSKIKGLEEALKQYLSQTNKQEETKRVKQ